MHKLSQDDFFVLQQDGTPAFLDRETRRHLSACVRVHSAHFKHEF